MMLLVASNASAQYPPCPPCPTSAPPTNVAWTSGSYITVITIGSTQCTVRVCYCTRTTSPGNNDFTVTSVATATPGCFAGLSTQDIVDAAYDAVLNDNPMGFPCPPCPNTTRYWQEARGTCWSRYVDPVTGVEIAEMCSTTGWCMTPIFVCCDPTTGARTNNRGTTVTFPQSCGTGCNTLVCP